MKNQKKEHHIVTNILYEVGIVREAIEHNLSRINQLEVELQNLLRRQEGCPIPDLDEYSRIYEEMEDQE